MHMKTVPRALKIGAVLPGSFRNGRGPIQLQDMLWAQMNSLNIFSATAAITA
jgi:hypothetical protein